MGGVFFTLVFFFSHGQHDGSVIATIVFLLLFMIYSRVLYLCLPLDIMIDNINVFISLSTSICVNVKQFENALPFYSHECATQVLLFLPNLHA